jgi:hypothetical protein
MGIMRKLVVGSLAVGAARLVMGKKKFNKATKTFTKKVQEVGKAGKSQINAAMKASKKKASRVSKSARKSRA